MNLRKHIDRALQTAARCADCMLLRLKQAWPAVLCAAIFLLVLSVASLGYALKEPRPSKKSPPVAGGGAAQSTSTSALAARALDGVLVSPSSTRLLPFGVMVENSADAWPLSGPAKADFVVEAPVEGGITRYLLFFDASTTVGEIGPVRSARPYFVDWAEALGAMYAHVGGSPASLEQIAGKQDFRDLNEFWNGVYFWRAARRSAPHNIFTRSELLLIAAGKKQYQSGIFRPWNYRESATGTRAGVLVGQLTVPYDGAYRATWRYDAALNDYVRYRNGAALADTDGSLVRAKNVVFILTDASVIDDIGRLNLRTMGRGRAWIFTNGEQHEAFWSRAAGEHIRFLTVDGLDAVFARGKTWMSVITNAEAFDEVSQ